MTKSLMGDGNGTSGLRGAGRVVERVGLGLSGRLGRAVFESGLCSAYMF